jgi:hypothetical protein
MLNSNMQDSAGQHRQGHRNSSNASQSVLTTYVQPVIMEGRMQVEGRQQDGGPVPSILVDLPPDYSQSTEPLLQPTAWGSELG